MNIFCDIIGSDRAMSVEKTDINEAFDSLKKLIQIEHTGHKLFIASPKRLSNRAVLLIQAVLAAEEMENV